MNSLKLWIKKKKMTLSAYNLSEGICKAKLTDPPFPLPINFKHLKSFN